VPPDPPSISFANNVQPIFNRSCATSTACHQGPLPAADLNLTAGVSYGQTVDVRSSSRPALFRVLPGKPDESYLVLKIEEGIPGDTLMPLGCPTAPQGGAVCPTPDEIESIRTWVAECAPDN